MKTILFVVLVAGSASAKPCPPAVTSAIDKAFPKSTVTRCVSEDDKFEAKLKKADGAAIEVDVAADGKILQIEESIAVGDVPAAVMKAFAAKYPKAKATGAERQTPTGGTPSYELAFSVDGKKKEATFTEAGGFVEEE